MDHPPDRPQALQFRLTIMNEPEEYLEADPGEKNETWIVIALGAVVGAIVLYMVYSQLGAIKSLPRAERLASHLAGMQIIFWVLASVLGVMAVHFFLFANRVSRAGRFPPPGMKVYRRTKVLKGKDVQRKTTILYGCAALILASAAALPLIFEWLRRALTPQ